MKSHFVLVELAIMLLWQARICLSVWLGLKAKVEIASEFRYREAIIKPNSLFIVISQSGETADTLEALKIAKEQGAKTFAICNVDNSNIVRLAHLSLLTRRH